MEISTLKSTLIEHLHSLINEQLRISEIITELTKQDTYSTCTGLESIAKASFHNGIIEISVNRIPEPLKLIRGSNKDYQNLKKIWINGILNALEKLELNNYSRDSKKVILIDIHYRSVEWDVDNYYIKFIIDAIRYSELIKTDSYKHIEYHVRGFSNSSEVGTKIKVLTTKQFCNIMMADLSHSNLSEE